MKAPNRLISPHEMSIILSEIQEFTSTTGSTTWEEVCAELHDAGYTQIEIEQVHREWKRGQVERTPITVDTSTWGDGTFTIEPNWDNGHSIVPPGINLVINHRYLPMPAALAVSIAEADEILVWLDAAIVQTGGSSHLASEQPVSLGAQLAGTDRLDTAEIYQQVREAVSVDAGHVREALATMLLALSDQLSGRGGHTMTIAETAFLAAQDAIELQADIEA